MKKVRTMLAATLVVSAVAWSGLAGAAPAAPGYGSTGDAGAGYAAGGAAGSTAGSSPCYTRYDYPKPGFGGNSDAHISADVESGGTLWVPEACAAPQAANASPPAEPSQVTQ